MYLELIIKYQELKKKYKQLQKDYLDLLDLVDEEFWNVKDLSSKF